ncbi:MAG: lipid-A-disaccharide synthase [Candidatus Omnitrophica bacterium CG1_02_46_14]|nr:MAG: lipid-A-disaccharide synthase [Candidatus Omnitrophica bacterium CG1_02_46_14]
MKIYIIAGEASGDLHGANLIHDLRTHAKEPLEIYGIGGDKIRDTGADGFFDLAHFHVTGLTDAIKRYPQYKKASLTILSKIKKVQPDLAVLIDNPGFNLHLAQKIHAMGIPIVYYIAPQLWAWGPKRIYKIKKYIKKVLVVFEFEKKIYENHAIPVAWVGHPLKDIVKVNDIHKNVSGSHKRLVTLLPGSRKGELKMLLPVFLKAAKLISKALPDVSFAMLKSTTMPGEIYDRSFKKYGISIPLIKKNPYDLIHESDLALACSGTVTLECAILGTPMIIAYKGSFLSYVAAKSLIKVDCIGLPNLVLGEKKFPELLQYDATPKRIAGEAVKILQNDKIRQIMKQNLLSVSEKLGEPGATERAAREILKVAVIARSRSDEACLSLPAGRHGGRQAI